MNSIQPQQEGRRGVKQRSRFERSLVWGGIVLLLFLAAIEATSRFSYDASLNGLDAAISSLNDGGRDRGVPEDKIGEYIKGFPVRSDLSGPADGATGEAQQNRPRRLLFHWPSLFRNFRMVVTLNEQNRAVLVEGDYSNAQQQGVSAAPQKAATASNEPAPLPLPKTGLPEQVGQCVALTVEDPKAINSMRKVRCGSMARELIRQSILIAARDEMRVGTLDATLGEVSVVSDSPGSYPFQVDVSVQSFSNVPDEVRFVVHISRADPSGKWFKWSSSAITVPAQPGLDTLADRLEALSRGEFVTALKEAGVQDLAAQPPAPVSIPDVSEQHLDLVSQFSLLRQLHAQRRANGETIENLGALVRAYANLGDLIDYHWSPMSKAFKARSLLYAQRMVAKYGKTSAPLAHRAYAWTLTGNHVVALEDCKAARADGSPVPDWLKLMEAFCQFNPSAFEEVDGELRELSMYLRMKLLDPVHERQSCLESIQDLVAENPACFRALERMCETKSLGTVRIATEGAANGFWQATYERLADVSDLPADPLQIVTQFQMRSQPVDPAIEQKTRVKLIDDLRKAAEVGNDPIEPSWNVLADMISDTTFVQAWRLLNVEAHVLCLPAKDIDQTVESLKPLVKGHRFEKYLTSFSSNPAAASAAMTELVNSTDSTAYEAHCLPVANAAYNANAQFYQRLCSHIDNHWDKIYDDLLTTLNPQIPAWEKDAGEILAAICPHQPLSIARAIRAASEVSDEKAKQWEEKYADNAYILLELGRKHQQLSHSADAIRCLKKSIDASPSHDACFELANEYQQSDDLDASEEVLKQALELPSYGLEAGRAHEKLATMLMRQDRWDEARVHAEGAAATYSGWGLAVGARCAEGMKDRKTAEQYCRALSERYEGEGDFWYFWCVRVGHGNLKAARKLAEKYWKTFGPSLSWDQRWDRGTQQILSGELKQAIDTFTAPIDKANQDYHLLVVASLLADKLGDATRRDALYTEIETQVDAHKNLPRLISLFRIALKDPNHFHWDVLSFQELADETQGNEVAFIYYSAGQFLGVHGDEELSRKYLRAAATAFDVQRSGCLLAAISLREQNVEIGDGRLHNQPDDRYPSVVLLHKGYRAKQEKKYDEAREYFNKAMGLLPDFTLGLLARGRMSEVEYRYADAVADYEELLRKNPDSEYGLMYLATIQASCDRDDLRNGPQALKNAEHAASLRAIPSSWHNWILAAAHAECGDFAKAIEFQGRALKEYPQRSDWQKQLALYREGKPYRFPTQSDSTVKDAAK